MPQMKAIQECNISLTNLADLTDAEIIQEYNKADIISFCSEYEGFGLVVAEAMSFGVIPVVLGSYSAIYDLLVDGENGIIVKDGDVAEFTENLKKLMLDDNLRNRLADKGLETCQRFTVSNLVDKWETIYNEPTLKRGIF